MGDTPFFFANSADSEGDIVCRSSMWQANSTNCDFVLFADT
jgi:hypothetical protein